MIKRFKDSELELPNNAIIEIINKMDDEPSTFRTFNSVMDDLLGGYIKPEYFNELAQGLDYNIRVIKKSLLCAGKLTPQQAEKTRKLYEIFPQLLPVIPDFQKLLRFESSFGISEPAQLSTPKVLQALENLTPRIEAYPEIADLLGFTAGETGEFIANCYIQFFEKEIAQNHPEYKHQIEIVKTVKRYNPELFEQPIGDLFSVLPFFVLSMENKPNPSDIMYIKELIDMLTPAAQEELLALESLASIKKSGGLQVWAATGLRNYILAGPDCELKTMFERLPKSYFVDADAVQCVILLEKKLKCDLNDHSLREFLEASDHLTEMFEAADNKRL